MKNYLKIWAVMVGFLAITACERKTYFTSDIRTRIENKNIDLMKIQYFVDRDVELVREISSDSAQVSRGKIIFRNGKYFDRVILKSGTRGICTAVYPNRLNISFEMGDDKFLTFAAPYALGVMNNVYQLANIDADGNTINTINYDGKLYNLVVPGRLPQLQVMKKLLEKERFNERIMKGRKVN